MAHLTRVFDRVYDFSGLKPGEKPGLGRIGQTAKPIFSRFWYFGGLSLFCMLNPTAGKLIFRKMCTLAVGLIWDPVT